MTGLPVESVQDYPRPPVLENVAQIIRIRLVGGLVAESNRADRVLEAHHAPTYYLPAEDVLGTLSSAVGRSFSEWKRVATCSDVELAGTTAPRAAWSYGEPTTGFAVIANYVAFYAHAMDACFIGDQLVTPQSGNFYGGWVTDNLRGRIKGAQGT